MVKIKTQLESKLDLEKKKEIITAKASYKGQVIILFKAEVSNGKVKIL
jgi:hypothetical protein|nr:MAG TPA: hypothetical protein [Caudoviricetes sp.]